MFRLVGQYSQLLLDASPMLQATVGEVEATALAHDAELVLYVEQVELSPTARGMLDAGVVYFAATGARLRETLDALEVVSRLYPSVEFHYVTMPEILRATANATA